MHNTVSLDLRPDYISRAKFDAHAHTRSSLLRGNTAAATKKLPKEHTLTVYRQKHKPHTRKRAVLLLHFRSHTLSPGTWVPCRKNATTHLCKSTCKRGISFISIVTVDKNNRRETDRSYELIASTIDVRLNIAPIKVSRAMQEQALTWGRRWYAANIHDHTKVMLKSAVLPFWADNFYC